MSPDARPVGERLATIEESLRAVHIDLADQAASSREDHHRLRAVEALMASMVEQQKETIRRQHVDLERLMVRLQRYAVATAFLALALSVTLAIVTHV